MQTTCPACFLNYDASGPGARCPACGAPAPGGAGQYAGQYGPPGGTFGVAPGGAAAAAWNTNVAAPPPPGELISTTFLIMNILMAVFCQPAGIISFVLCDQAKNLQRQGRYDEAQAKVKSARLSLWIGAGVSVALIGAYVIFIVAIVATAASHGRR